MNTYRNDYSETESAFLIAKMNKALTESGNDVFREEEQPFVMEAVTDCDGRFDALVRFHYPEAPDGWSYTYVVVENGLGFYAEFDESSLTGEHDLSEIESA